MELSSQHLGTSDCEKWKLEATLEGRARELLVCQGKGVNLDIVFYLFMHLLLTLLVECANYYYVCTLHCLELTRASCRTVC